MSPRKTPKNGNGKPERKSGSNGDIGTLERKNAFLDALQEFGAVNHAAVTAGISRSVVYRWKKADEEFALAWDASVQSAVEELEKSLYERGMGWDADVFDKFGKKTGTKHVYDTTSAIFWLKGHAPDKYRERFEQTGTVKLDLAVTIRDGLKKVMARPEVANRLADEVLGDN